LKKTVKSLYLCDRSTDFDELWRNDAHWPLPADQSLKFRILKIQHGGGRHLEKSQKKSRYLRNGLTDLHEIWHAYAKWAS